MKNIPTYIKNIYVFIKFIINYSVTFSGLRSIRTANDQVSIRNFENYSDPSKNI